MSSNLIPTPIVNKNGVATTVHKKAETSTPSSVTRVPAPTVISIQSLPISDVVTEIKRVFQDPFVTVPSDIPGHKVVETLESYPLETQQYIADMHAEYEDDILIKVLISLADKEHPATEVENVLYLYDIVPPELDEFINSSDWIEDGLTVATDLLADIKGLRSYDLEGFDLDENKTLRNQSDHTKEQIRLLAETNWSLNQSNFASHLSEYKKGHSKIKDDRLAQLVIDYPDRHAALLQLLHERRAFDFEMTQDFLQSPSPSISSGSL